MFAPLVATLIVALPSNDGLAVCADRRSFSPISGISDSYRKLMPAGDRAIFAVSGQGEFRTRQGATVFDVRKAVTDGLEKFGFPSVKEWSTFVKNALLNPLSGSGALTMIAPPEVPNGPVFKVAFFYFLGNDPVEAEIGVFYRSGIDDVPRSELRVSRLSGANPYVMMGAPMVPIEMMSGHDARFDDMRKVYASFRAEPTPSADKVITFEQWLIRESSRRTYELTGSKIQIGATADCAQVSPTGVKWLLYGTRSSDKQHSSRDPR